MLRRSEQVPKEHPTEPRRRPGDDEMVRTSSGWSAWQLLDSFPSVRHPSFALGSLLAAGSVSQGPPSLAELIDFASAYLVRNRPRYEKLLTSGFEFPAKQKRWMSQQKRAGGRALAMLRTIHARARNELRLDERYRAAAGPYAPRPSQWHEHGLRYIDIDRIAWACQISIFLAEMVQRPNVTGARFSFGLVHASPPPIFIQEWWDRFQSRPLRGFRYFSPPDYRRVVLISNDGRLAYDPGDRASR